MSEQTRHSSEADMLSALLGQLDMRAGVFFTGEFCGTHTYDGGDNGYLHLLRRGPLRVRRSSGQVHTIEAPSLILLPKATSHVIETLAGVDAELVCATLDFADARANPLLLGFPELLVIPLDDLKGLEATLDLLFEEAFAQRFGHSAAVDRLVEVLLILLLRHCLDTGRVASGLLAGLADPKIARSLQAMHLQPAQDWTVERLANTAGMSRANFAAAFKATVGLSPGDYLTMLRVNKAKQALLSGKHLKIVAAQVGYRSPTAFARAFHRRVGCNPRDFVSRARSACEQARPPDRRIVERN